MHRATGQVALFSTHDDYVIANVQMYNGVCDTRFMLTRGECEKRNKMAQFVVCEVLTTVHFNGDERPPNHIPNKHLIKGIARDHEGRVYYVYLDNSVNPAS